jgi:hypothetical protein
MTVERETRRYPRSNAHKAMLVVRGAQNTFPAWKTWDLAAYLSAHNSPHRRELVYSYFSMFRKVRCEGAPSLEICLRAEVWV